MPGRVSAPGALAWPFGSPQSVALSSRFPICRAVVSQCQHLFPIPASGRWRHRRQALRARRRRPALAPRRRRSSGSWTRSCAVALGTSTSLLVLVGSPPSGRCCPRASWQQSASDTSRWSIKWFFAPHADLCRTCLTQNICRPCECFWARQGRYTAQRVGIVHPEPGRRPPGRRFVLHRTSGPRLRYAAPSNRAFRIA